LDKKNDLKDSNFEIKIEIEGRREATADICPFFGVVHPKKGANIGHNIEYTHVKYLI
jgi:hypothetical protein